MDELFTTKINPLFEQIMGVNMKQSKMYNSISGEGRNELSLTSLSIANFSNNQCSNITKEYDKQIEPVNESNKSINESTGPSADNDNDNNVNTCTDIDIGEDDMTILDQSTIVFGEEDIKVAHPSTFDKYTVSESKCSPIIDKGGFL